MENVTGAVRGTLPRSESRATSPAYQAYILLYIAFIVAPIVAGIDKFLHLLTNWDMYLAPRFARILPVATHDFMLAVGVVEVIAGIIVAIKPRIGAYIVAIWLACIIVNLLLVPSFFDIALRDFGLALGALALGRLSQQYDSSKR
jgi:hypothetical protein